MIREKRMELFIKFYEENKRWPNKNETYEGENIGMMVENARKGRTKISEQYLPILKKLNFFETNSQKKIHDKVLLLIEFFHKNDFWPFENEEYNNVKISYFADKVLKGDIIINETDKTTLEKLNFFEGKRKNTLHKKVILLNEFFNSFNRWPNENESYKNINIGNIAIYIRKNPNSIYETDKVSLDNLNFFKNKKYWKLHENVMIANHFFEKNKRWITSRKDIYNEIPLNKCFSYILSNKENLDSEDFKLLNSKKFFWNKIDQKVILITDFFDEFKCWPRYNETFRGIFIGNYITDIRKNYSNLSLESKKLLEDRYFIAEKTPEERKHHKVQLLLEFHKIYKRWPNRKDIFKSFNIGDFEYNLRKGITKISAEDKLSLINSNFIFEK